jgi:hypothetical protein
VLVEEPLAIEAERNCLTVLDSNLDEAEIRDVLARHEDWRDPPPPERHHHHHNGSAIAGVVATGLIGGIIGGAIANGGAYEPPPPPPRCWYESRPVQNEYDDGWHNERMRVCE